MTADLPAERDRGVTNLGSISMDLCKGGMELIFASFLADFLSINSWDRDNKRVLLAHIGINPH